MRTCLSKNDLSVLLFTSGLREDATDSDILEAMKRMAGGENRQYRPNLESIFKDLKVDLAIKDPQDRVNTFHSAYLKLIADHQLENSFK